MKKYLYAAISVLTWSTLATIAKVLLNDMPNYQVIFISSLFGFIFLAVTNVVNGSYSCIKQYSLSNYLHMAGLGFIGLFLYSALYYYGLSQLTSQDACILNYLWPMMLVIFSCVILKEKITAKKIVAMVCSFIGIIILFIIYVGNCETR